MSQFEYLMVLVSIILGLGITTLLRGATNLMKSRETEVYWIHVVWTMSLLVWHVGVWQVRWATRTESVWNFGELVTFLLVPVLLFILADLLSVDVVSEEPDLKKHFYDRAPAFFTVAALLMMAVTWTRVTVFGVGFLSLDTLGNVLGILLAMLLAVTRRERVHAVASISVLAFLLLSFSRFQIG